MILCVKSNGWLTFRFGLLKFIIIINQPRSNLIMKKTYLLIVSIVAVIFSVSLWSPVRAQVSAVNLTANNIGMVGTNDSIRAYQINLSFQGSSAQRPVSKWVLKFNCVKEIYILATPKASCADGFSMSSTQNNGNVLNKPFLFKNDSATSTVMTTLMGYDKTGNIMGTSSLAILVPQTMPHGTTGTQTITASEMTASSSQIITLSFTTKDYVTATSTKIYFSCQNDISVMSASTSNVVVACNTWTNFTSVPNRLDIVAKNTSKVVRNFTASFYANYQDKPTTSIRSGVTINVLPAVISSPTSTPTTVSTSTVITNPVVPTASSTTVTASLTSSTSDYAGPWGTFTPGNYNGNKNDWGWTVKLDMNGNIKTISDITVKNEIGEAWSTSNSKYYALVVMRNGQRLNNAYGQNISIGSSTETLQLYGQQANTTWNGAMIVVTFTDGTVITGMIAKQQNAYMFMGSKYLNALAWSAFNSYFPFLFL